MNKHQNNRERVDLAKEAQAVRVPKFIVADHDGNCFAALIVCSGTFTYDAETDALLWITDRDGKSLFNLFTEGEVRNQGRYRDDNYAKGDRRP